MTRVICLGDADRYHVRRRGGMTMAFETAVLAERTWEKERKSRSSFRTSNRSRRRLEESGAPE
jgi:hypothetical protein